MATLLNHTRFHRAIDPALVNNAAAEGRVLDKQDFDNAKGVLFAIYVGALDVALSALKVQQSDTETDATTLGGTPEDVIDVSDKPGASDDDEIRLVYVPMDQWTKRYLQLQATVGNGSTGANLSAIAIADRIGESGVNADDLGVAAVEIA